MHFQNMAKYLAVLFSKEHCPPSSKNYKIGNQEKQR